MIVFPNAKINLGLNILSKRMDGYHNIDTLFYPIPIYDVLEVLHDDTQDGCLFSSSGLTIDCTEEDNLVVKAYLMLKKAYGIGGVRVHLYKNIPFGAGLGGGSSDAAFALKCFNKLFNLNLSVDELKQLAAKLGADCPFFIDNVPSLANGIGDELTAVDIDLTGYKLVIVKPDVCVPTALAYKGVKPLVPELTVEEVTRKEISFWQEYLVNAFEESVFVSFPEIEAVKVSLMEKGSLYVSMSGSGASVYGIFKKRPSLTGFPDSYFVWSGEL